MLRQAIGLTVPVYDVLWQRFELGEKHNALVCPSPGATVEERAMLEHEVMADLERHGLARSGQPHPDLINTFRLIARSPIEFYGWVNSPEEPDWSVLVVAQGDNAIRATLKQDVLTLEPIRATALAATLVDVLPDVPAARGRSVSVPVDANTNSGRGPGDSGGWLQSAGPSQNSENQQLQRILAAPRTGGGQLYVTVRGSQGRRRCTNPLNYFDTEGGRWMTQVRPGGNGQRWATVAPANKRMLAARLGEMQAELTSR